MGVRPCFDVASSLLVSHGLSFGSARLRTGVEPTHASDPERRMGHMRQSSMRSIARVWVRLKTAAYSSRRAISSSQIALRTTFGILQGDQGHIQPWTE